MIYLDWAASAPPHTDEIIYAYHTAAAAFANPSSQHALGKQAHRLLEQARTRCAAVLQVPPSTLYFTSGGSEANSLVLLSVLMHPNKGSIALSAIEHPSIREQARALSHCGWDIIFIPVDKNGIVHPEAVIDALRDDTVLAAIMSVNNEMGAIQPIADIKAALAAHRVGKRPIHVHSDCVQAIGKLPVAELCLKEVDSASMSAHKIGGPRGIGFLYAKKTFPSFIRGGSQEQSIRPGTENIAGALALAACLEKTYEHFDEKYAKACSLHKLLVEELSRIPACTLVPQGRSALLESFSPWVMQVSFKHVPSEVLMRCLSDRGIFISAGSACSSKKQTRPVMEALHLDSETAQNTVRISIGESTERSDIETFLHVLKEVLKELSVNL